MSKALTQAVKYGFLGVVIAVCLGQGRLLFTLLVRSMSCPRDAVVGELGGIDHRLLSGEALRGKSALVVGGTRGIGRGIAKAVERAGGNTTVVGRSAASFGFDLSSVAGCHRLVDALRGRRFDYVFLTIGSWPDYAEPLTADGIEKVIALDLVARHVVLSRLVADGLLEPGAVVVNTLASAVSFPMASAVAVKVRLRNNRAPKNLIFALLPVALAADAYLLGAPERFPDLHFLGVFPGLVDTDIVKTYIPPPLLPIYRFLLWPFSISEDESGTAHLAIAASPNARRRPVSYWTYLLEARFAHRAIYDKSLVDFVWDYLQTTAEAKAPNPPEP